jgi:hypothetical protein
MICIFNSTRQQTVRSAGGSFFFMLKKNLQKKLVFMKKYLYFCYVEVKKIIKTLVGLLTIHVVTHR